MTRRFDVHIARSLYTEGLGWPEPGEAGWAGEDSGLGGNRSYCDLRRMTWGEARRVLDYENELIGRINSAADPEEEYFSVEDELHEDPEGIYGLDLGVAAAVVALSAARCIPFSSCNAGAFGGNHHEAYPLVAFYARPAHIDLLLECAETSCCGIEHGDRGCVVLYAADVMGIHHFASEVIFWRAAFRKLRISRPSRRNQAEVDSQPMRNRQFRLL